MVLVQRFLHIWHNGVDVMVHQAPLAETEGSYGEYTYRIKGDDRVQLVEADGITTTMHNNVVNAKHWVGAKAVLDSISPDTAVMGGADLTLSCIGSGFQTDSIIVFNGGEEPTTFVSDTEVTTTVKPSLAGVEGSYPVLVRTSGAETEPQMFTFTEAVGRKAKK